MRGKRKQKGSLALGFAATVGVLSILTVGLYLSSSYVPQLPIPDKLPTYGGVLGRYVPQNFLQVTLDNVSAIRLVNNSFVNNQVFLNLDEPKLSMNSTDVNLRLSIAFSQPNASVNIVLLNPLAFKKATLAFESTTSPSSRNANFTLYTVIDRTEKTPTGYWITTLPKDYALAYSAGALPALQVLDNIIGVYNGTAPSILARQDIDRMLYTVDGPSHLALGIQNFAGVVRTGQVTLIAVDTARQSAYISYVVKFSDSDQASSQVGRVKSVYLSAHQFVVYDELVKAVEIQPVSNLRVAIGLAG